MNKQEKQRKKEKLKRDLNIKDEKKKVSKKKSFEKMSNDEVEKVMENFMNKLFVSPNLLEDEKLNYRIEKIFENQVFQKMVENANVLEDAGVISNSNASRDHGRREKSEEIFDANGNILDSRLIEKSELLVPYNPDDERFRDEEGEKMVKRGNFSSKIFKEKFKFLIFLNFFQKRKSKKSKCKEKNPKRISKKNKRLKWRIEKVPRKTRILQSRR